MHGSQAAEAQEVVAVVSSEGVDPVHASEDRVWASHFAGRALAGVPDKHQLQLGGFVVPQQMWWPCGCLSLRLLCVLEAQVQDARLPQMWHKQLLAACLTDANVVASFGSLSLDGMALAGPQIATGCQACVQHNCCWAGKPPLTHAALSRERSGRGLRQRGVPLCRQLGVPASLESRRSPPV